MNEEKQLNVEEISDEELEQVAGGFVICRGPGKYEVIDDRTGDVVATYDNKTDAMRACMKLGLRAEMIGQGVIDELKSRDPEEEKRRLARLFGGM